MLKRLILFLAPLLILGVLAGGALGAVRSAADAADANIQISPLTATSLVNTGHTLTGHVNVNPGTGSVNAPDGTTISFTTASGPGSLSAPSCTTTGGTGSCSVTLTSAVVGTTVVNDSTTVTVSGVSLTRTTNGVAPNSGPANETWAATPTVASGPGKIEFTGFVQSLPTTGSLIGTWSLQGLTVNVTTATKIEGTPHAGDFVIVEGTLTANGDVQAKKIEVKKDHVNRHQNQDDTRPGWGCGDLNHDHTLGPPGRIGGASPCNQHEHEDDRHPGKGEGHSKHHEAD